MRRESQRLILLALLVAGGGAASPGCGDPDDAGDGATLPTDPCDVDDLTDHLGGDPLAGTTASSEDNFLASCSTEGGVETVFRFTPETDGDYLVELDPAGTSFLAVLYAFSDCGDPAGTELACGNSEMFGAKAPSLYLELTAGQTVYLVVEVEVEADDLAGDFQISISEVFCGDGRVLGNESCDDGNTDAGDGCDATCEWECEDDSFEDDDSVETALDLDSQGLPATFDELVLCPGDNDALFGVAVDLFAVEVGQGEFVAAELTPNADADVACDDMQLRILLVDSELNLADGSYSSANSGCRQLAVAPTAGTWYFAVLPSDLLAPPQGYGLEVTRGAAVCGDGIAEGPEACDDGNSDAGDGCEADCTATSPCAVADTEDLGVLSTGSTTDLDATLSADSFAALQCSESGGVTAAVAFELSGGGDLRVDHSTDDPGLRLQLFQSDDSCAPVSMCSEALFPDFGSMLTQVEPGSYVLAIESATGSVGDSIAISLTAP